MSAPPNGLGQSQTRHAARRFVPEVPAPAPRRPEPVRRGADPGAAVNLLNPACAGTDPAPVATAAHPIELAGLLHELSVRLLAADDLAAALERLAAFTAGVVPGTLRCSVVLIGENAPLTHAAFGTVGQAYEQAQFADGNGPAMSAARTRTLVTVADLATDERWPDLCAAARTEGLSAVAALPLDVRRASVGAVSVYLAHPLDPDLLLTTMAVVNQAEILLGELHRRDGLGEDPTVDRAVGVIIAQRGCGVQEAYDVLQETSQRLGLDRHTVAERLITAAARNAAGTRNR